MGTRTEAVRLLFILFLVYITNSIIITNARITKQAMTIPVMAPVDKPVYICTNVMCKIYCSLVNISNNSPVGATYLWDISRVS